MQTGPYAYPSDRTSPGDPSVVYDPHAYLLAPGLQGNPGAQPPYTKPSSLNYQALSGIVVDDPPVVYELDGLKLGGIDGGPGWLAHWPVETTTGWHKTAKRRTKRTAKPGAFGSYRDKSFVDERGITLTGRCDTVDVASRLYAEDVFNGLCVDGSRTFTLTVTDQLGRIRTAEVEIDDSDFVVQNERLAKWMLTLGAPDPRKHDGRLQRRRATAPAPGVGGVDFSAGMDFSGGLDLGTPSPEDPAQVSNEGAAPAYPFFQLTGPAVKPVITGMRSGARIAYRADVEPGETLTINCDPFPWFGYPEQSIYSDRHGNVMTYTSYFDWPVVEAGDWELFTVRAGGVIPEMYTWLRSAWW